MFAWYPFQVSRFTKPHIIVPAALGPIVFFLLRPNWTSWKLWPSYWRLPSYQASAAQAGGPFLGCRRKGTELSSTRIVGQCRCRNRKVNLKDHNGGVIWRRWDQLAHLAGWPNLGRKAGSIRQEGYIYCTSLNLRWKSPWRGGEILCMIKNCLHLSPLPAVNTTKHLFYFSHTFQVLVKS